MNKAITLSIDVKIWNALKKKSKRQGWVISKKVENYFRLLLKEG